MTTDLLTEPPIVEPAARPKTTYLIFKDIGANLDLEGNEPGLIWEFQGQIEAYSTEAARKAFVGEKLGGFVAVAGTMWQPHEQRETKTVAWVPMALPGGEDDL